ncbi:MAG: YraN family protein [Anaerolineae bacterium]|nr:YraN family protein [Anaerolineae bacterium]MDW8070374.1 YraN family protein [Anaerolineae bacterium]
MRRTRQKLGREGEQIAAVYLQRQGYTILEHNWRCRRGEVDIVARDGDSLVFVEVRTWRSGQYGPPEASITPRKQAKILEVAQSYLQAAGLDDVKWRIDVVAIEMDDVTRVKRLSHIRNAVEAC